MANELGRLFNWLTSDAAALQNEAARLRQAGDLAGALERLAQARDKAPQDEAVRQAWETAAYELYAQGLDALFDHDWERAVAALTPVARQWGTRHDAALLLQVLQETHRTAQAAWAAVRIGVPPDQRTSRARVMQLFDSLPQTDFSASFEVVSVAGRVVFQAAAPRQDLHLLRAPLAATYPKAEVQEGPDAIVEGLQALGETPVAGGARCWVLAKRFFYLPLRLPGDGVDTVAGLVHLLGQLPAGVAGLQLIVTPLNEVKWRAAHKEIWGTEPSKLAERLLPDLTRTYRKATLARWRAVQADWEAKMSSKLLTATLQTFAFAVDARWLETMEQGLAGFLSQFAGEHNALVVWPGEAHLPADPAWHAGRVQRREVAVPARARDLFNVRELASFWQLPQGEGLSPRVQQAAPPTRPAPVTVGKLSGAPLGTSPRQGKPEPVVLPAADRRRHLYVIGASGTGKSTFLLNLIAYDLAQGHGLAVIDPKGDLIERALALVPRGRQEQVVWIDPSDEARSVGLNPLATVPAARRSLAAAELVSILQRLFPTWGPQLERYLRYAALTLLEVPGATLAEMPLLFASLAYRRWAVEQVTDPLVQDFWEFELGDAVRQDATVGALLNRIEPFLSDVRVRHIVGQSASTFDVRRIMDGGGILLADLAKGKIGEHASSLLGALLVSQVQLAAMARAAVPETERRDFYLYVDEFQNFTTSAFAQILAEARAFGLSLTVAHQYAGQLAAEVRDAVLGTVGSVVAFRVGPQDAAVLARQLPPVEADALVQLDNFRALAKVSLQGKTSAPFDLQLVPPPLQPEAVPVAWLKAQVRERITRPREAIDAALRERRRELRRQFTPPAPGAQTEYDER